MNINHFFFFSTTGRNFFSPLPRHIEITPLDFVVSRLASHRGPWQTDHPPTRLDSQFGRRPPRCSTRLAITPETPRPNGSLLPGSAAPRCGELLLSTPTRVHTPPNPNHNLIWEVVRVLHLHESIPLRHGILTTLYRAHLGRHYVVLCMVQLLLK